MDYEAQCYAISDDSSHSPLLDDTTTPPEEAPYRRWRRRPSAVVLVLMSGLLGAASLFALLASVKETGSTTGQEKIVDRGVSEGVSLKSFPGARGAPPYTWSDTALAWQRTAFHFQPTENWMNDPNGCQ